MTAPAATHPLAEHLASGLEAMGLALAGEVQAGLLHYLDLLDRWNRVYNLTAVRDPHAMVARHLLDSLSVLPYLDGAPKGSLADVGSGAGLPGIPLALARPERPVTLIDSVQKKTRFQRQAIRELGLASRVAAVNGRVEALTHQRGCHAVVIARAFAPLARLCVLAAPLLAPGGVLLAMKGPQVAEELIGLPSGWGHEIHPLAVPGESATRRLVILTPPLSSRRSLP